MIGGRGRHSFIPSSSWALWRASTASADSSWKCPAPPASEHGLEGELAAHGWWPTRNPWVWRQEVVWYGVFLFL